MFVTIGLSPRRPVFGRVYHDHVEHTSAGEAAVRCIREAEGAFAGRIRLHRFVVMPDHLHLRFSWPAQPGALAVVGRFVGRIKQTIHYTVAGHAPSIWEHGYHDLICTSEDMNRSVDGYIGYNPLKHWLMRCDRTLLHVREPILLPAGCADGSVWRAVGDASLLDAAPLVAMRISRKIPMAKLPEVVEVCRRGLDRGYRYVSTFFSPGERALATMVAAQDRAVMVRLAPTFLDLAYRPHGHEPLLFASRRLLVLSRMVVPGVVPTRHELLDLNEIAARIALSSPGGKAVYVQWDGACVRYAAQGREGPAAQVDEHQALA